jgi:S1-C subfamily serine protease
MTFKNDNDPNVETPAGGQVPAWPPTGWSTEADWSAQPAPNPPPAAPHPADWSAPAATELPGTAWAAPASTEWLAPTSEAERDDPDPKPKPQPEVQPAVPPTTRSSSGRRGGIRTILAAGLLSATLASVGTTALVGGLRPAIPAASAAPVANANPAVTGTRSPTDDITAVVATARQSVVTITTNGVSPRGLSADQVPTGVGSGIIVTANGYILTNRHVIEGSSSLTVALADGTEYPATLVKVSETTDLALVKIDATGLVAATIGDSSAIQVGQTAIAIGSPLGTFTETVTKGIISGLGRTITVRDEQTGRPTQLTDLIQTDAAINPGNSGGPLLDDSGAVVGVDTAIAGSAQGIGFAIPISAASDLISLARGSAI